MIRLEQIQLLEKKINKALDIISLLKQENHALKSTIQKSQERMAEMENLLEQFKGEQNRIEAGILSALDKLDQLEDQVSEGDEAFVQSDSEPSVSETSVEEEAKIAEPSTTEEDVIDAEPSAKEEAEITEPSTEEVDHASAETESDGDNTQEPETSQPDESRNVETESEETTEDSEQTKPAVDMFGNQESDTSVSSSEVTPSDEEAKNDVELDIF